MRYSRWTVLFALALSLSLAACSSGPAEPVGPTDGAVWVDVDVNLPSSPCAPTSAPQPPMPETPCAPSTLTSPCPETSSASLLGDPLPLYQFAGEFQDAPYSAVALAGPDSLRDAPPWAAYLFLGALGAFVVYAVSTRKRRRYSRRILPVLLVALMLAGCQMTPVLKGDLDAVVDTEREVDEAKAETFQRAIADGKPIEVATGDAFGAYVAARPKPGEESDLSLLGILGILAGGGATGTVITRLLRGSSLKSGSASKATS